MDHSNFLTNFQKSSKQMIAINDRAYDWRDYYSRREVRNYTIDEIERIIKNGSIDEKRKLSQSFYITSGHYKQIIVHYASLLKYVGMLNLNLNSGSYADKNVKKRYNEALDFVELMNLPVFLTKCAEKALLNGAYYGIILNANRKNFQAIDLPTGFCRSRLEDADGNCLIEFDVSYFNTILDAEDRKNVLKTYPSYVSKYYHSWNKGKQPTSFVVLPPNIGICFSFLDGKPFFLNIIPSILQYEKAIENEQEKNEEEIRKIIVQKMPHLNDGNLVFEPEEAEEMHLAAVGMLKGNKNLSVLTTYADIEAIGSKTSNDNTSASLDRMIQNVYSRAGVSGEIFASTNSATIDASLKKDTSMMMILANQFSVFISGIINSIFGNNNITFKYSILPITYFNDEKFADTSFKLASSGYSFLMPALALGLSQRDLSSIKDLENDLLELDKKLKPLMSSYTQTNKEEGGRPEKDNEDKAEKTVRNEEVDGNGKTN